MPPCRTGPPDNFCGTPDPVVTAIVEEIFETLAATSRQEVYDSLITTASPALSSLIAAPPASDNASLQSIAVELLNAILRGRKGDLGSAIGPGIWPALFHCMLTTDDSDTVQVLSLIHI